MGKVGWPRWSDSLWDLKHDCWKSWPDRTWEGQDYEEGLPPGQGQVQRWTRRVSGWWWWWLWRGPGADLHSFSPNWLRKPTSPKVHFDAVGGGGGLSGLHSLRTRAQASVFQFLKWGRIKLRMLSITCLRCLQTVNILGIAVCCLGNVEKWYVDEADIRTWQYGSFILQQCY